MWPFLEEIKEHVVALGQERSVFVNGSVARKRFPPSLSRHKLRAFSETGEGGVVF